MGEEKLRLAARTIRLVGSGTAQKEMAMAGPVGQQGLDPHERGKGGSVAAGDDEGRVQNER